jgi:hypothetical protein
MQLSKGVSRENPAIAYFKRVIKEIRKRNPYDYKYQYVKKNHLKSLKILTDDVEFRTVKPDKDFDFDQYSDTIVSMVNGSYQKFSIGIYGEWGTGKTTLMKLVERKLRPYIFSWNNVPGTESVRIKTFLKENFDGVNWLDESNLRIHKSEDEKRLTITDNNDSNSVSITLKENSKAILEINNEKVYDFFVEKDEDGISVRENNILTVWFNAWRYEKEEQFALIPLMKTIAYAMGEHPIYKNMKPILLKSIKILSRDILRNLATTYFMTEKGVQEFEENFLSKLENLPEIDKDTIYFDGIKKIEEKMQSIFVEYPSSRIVVFIDDLDRCSPETALQVFESVKVFLEIKGFVFIIGLSREALDKLIKAKYENMGLKEMSGEQYIRKIIQIEINIQKWKNYAIEELIDKLSLKVDKQYRDDISIYKPLILKAVEQNPRQTKRFINNFIVALSANPSLKSEEFLVSEVLTKRWPTFYQDMNSNTEFREVVKRFSHMPDDERPKVLYEMEKDKDKETPVVKKILDIDSELWNFLYTNQEPLSNLIEDWDVYRSAKESAKIPYDKLSNMAMKMDNLMKKYHDDLVAQNKITVTEFWSQESEDNFLGTLMLLRENEDSLELTDLEKEVLDRLLTVMPVRLSELEKNRLIGDQDGERKAEIEIRMEYGKAMQLFKRLFDRQLSRYKTTK